ncbi:MAG: cytochrome C [Gammaproteobacteria bacterium]|nr:MAG: cytochrome C [Gammaproteobacteria bacterium]
MKLGEQGRFAADRHRRALRAGATCIDCHQGISHHLPSPPPLLAEKDYDPEEAEDIMEVCAGCHGDKGQGAPDGEYPRLAGLNAHYIARQLRHFKSHERINIPMIPYANERELPEPDVRTIATYLSRIELPTKLEPIEENEIGEGFDALARLEASKAVLNIPRYPGNVEAGGRLYRKECAGCHGLDGRGRVGRIGDRVWVVPTLVGQHSNYLLRQIRKFRKGERRHDRPEDAAIFRRFSDAEIGDLLAWLSVQDD